MARQRNYENWTREQLIDEVEVLRKQKTYGLVWETDKTKEIFDCYINWDGEQTKEVFPSGENKFPVLKEIKANDVLSDKKDNFNIIIEGDNYHSLAVLNFTHQKAIDLIYIDPPYNTGNKSWKYNNDYVDSEDAYRHSKFLSFMSKRLKLAKNLLKDDGVIVVTIDDHEIFSIGLLMDELFGEQNRLGVVTIVHNPRGRSDDKFFATSHEYALFYAKCAEKVTIHKLDLTEDQRDAFKHKDDVSNYRLLPLRRSGSNSKRENRPNLHYPIYYNPRTRQALVEKPSESGFVEIYPIDSKGIERVWRWGKETLSKLLSTDVVIKESGDGYSVMAKDRIKAGRRPMTHWVDPKYDASSHGTILLEKILGKNKIFDYPKSLYALIDTLQITTKDKKDATILDFFAGSGTTGHAVLELNKIDGGQRKFILCTNNENGICKDVCYPRIKNVMNGYPGNRGLGGNLKYFETGFVNSSQTDSNKKAIINKSTEMICVKENAFEPVIEAATYRVFRNSETNVGIIFDDEAISDFITEAKNIKGKFNIYVFSLDESVPSFEFKELQERVKLCPIPEVILHVYRRIFK